MKDISHTWPKTAGRVQIGGYWSSDDGLVSGVGKAGIEFVQAYETSLNKSNAHNP